MSGFKEFEGSLLNFFSKLASFCLDLLSLGCWKYKHLSVNTCLEDEIGLQSGAACLIAPYASTLGNCQGIPNSESSAKEL